jgi:predicted anti-sigma-YlaC factor YlaD
MNSILYRVMGRFRHRVLGQPSCEEVNGFLADYLDGALTEETARLYEAHIKRCPPCGAYFRQYKLTMELARNSRDEKVPVDLVQHTLDFLRERREN